MVEVPNNSATQTLRDKLSEAIKEFDAIIKPGGTITFLGTPQNEDSIYNHLPSRGYTVRIWPAKFPTEQQIDDYQGQLAPAILQAVEDNPSLVGLPTDPKRFSQEDIAARELSYGSAGFALQFMLLTRLSDAEKYPLKLKDLLVTDVAPDEAPEKLIWCSAPDREIKDVPCVGISGDRYYSPMRISDSWKEYTGSVMAIDPSGRGADETSYAVVKMLNGFLFVPTAGGFRGGYDKETLEGLAKVAVWQKVAKIIVESNFGDGMFSELLKPYLTKAGWQGEIEETRSTTQKEKRICDTLEPVMTQHRLVVDKTLIQKDFDSTRHYPGDIAVRYQLFYQMSRITREKGALAKDDRLDALAIAVAYWTEQMSLDADEQIQLDREELIEKELELWTTTMNQPLTDIYMMKGSGGVMKALESGAGGGGSFIYNDNDNDTYSDEISGFAISF